MKKVIFSCLLLFQICLLQSFSPRALADGEICGDTWQRVGDFTYNPPFSTPYYEAHSYTATGKYDIFWTDGHERRGVELVGEGYAFTSTITQSPRYCAPTFGAGMWTSNTSGHGFWFNSVQNQSSSGSGCVVTNTVEVIARYYCDGCGSEERPQGEAVANEAPVLEIGPSCSEEDGDDPSPCEQQYGPGWFFWQGTNQCVPPECASCEANGGTSCFGGICWTPVLVDLAGNGFALTNKDNGILFRPSPGAAEIRTAWTAANSDDSWLVLDRNSNGFVDDASELFSCAAQQPTPPSGQIGNGFIALAEFDKVANGGNADGKIDWRDAVFSQLQLWNDANHNGVSEPNELTYLSTSAVRSIDLDYKESRRTDEFGNKFKYRAKVKDVRGAQVGRWAWDVFLVAGEQ